MSLLRLDPSVREFIRSLGVETPERSITERKLKALTALRDGAQLLAARRRLPGFAAFEAKRATA